MRLSNNIRAARAWSEQDVATAAATWQKLIIDRYGEEPSDIPRGARSAVFAAIAAKLGRPAQVIENRFGFTGPSFASARRSLGGETGGLRLSTERVAERTQRMAAAAERSLTATIFGDPAPGYSALDRRRA